MLSTSRPPLWLQAISAWTNPQAWMTRAQTPLTRAGYQPMVIFWSSLPLSLMRVRMLRLPMLNVLCNGLAINSPQVLSRVPNLPGN